MSDLSRFVRGISGNGYEYIENAKHYVSDATAFAGHLIAEHPNEFITAVATCVVAWFTFVLARSTTRLWESGERQIKLSRETAERQLRAFVFCKGFTPIVNVGD